MRIQTPPHNKAGLFAAAPVLLELSQETFLELSGNADERIADRIVLFHKLRVNGCNAVHADIDTAVNISVGNTLCSFIQFPYAFALQLLAGSFFRHIVQDPFDIRSRTVILFALILGIFRDGTADRGTDAVCLLVRNSSFFRFRGLLLSGAGTSAAGLSIFRIIWLIRGFSRLRCVFIVFRLSLGRSVFAVRLTFRRLGSCFCSCCSSR